MEVCNFLEEEETRSPVPLYFRSVLTLKRGSVRLTAGTALDGTTFIPSPENLFHLYFRAELFPHWCGKLKLMAENHTLPSQLHHEDFAAGC